MRYFEGEARKRGIANTTFNICEPSSAETDLGRVSTQGRLGKILWQLHGKVDQT